MRLASILAETVGRTLDAETSLEQARAVSERDALTGLLNRGALDRDVTACFERVDGRSPDIGLLFIDLDGFKALNDAYGHAAGDAVLVRLAALLQGLVRQRDAVYRFGGDEFAVLVRGGGLSQTTKVAERLLRLTSAPARRPDDRTVPVFRMSIGLSVARPGATAAALMAAADTAMYEAKRAGGGVIRSDEPLDDVPSS